NNLLAVVIGSAEALSESLGDHPELRGLAEVAMDAAERGAELVSRLLSFARNQPLAPQAIDCDAFLAGLLPMRQRALGCAVRVDLDVATPGLACAADQTQLTSAVLNLCINARDAMPNGGRIVLRADRTPAADGRPSMVELSVEDDGEGMSPQVRAR